MPVSSMDENSLLKLSLWFIGAVPVIQRTDETCQPVLVLALRGPHAHSVWKDFTGSLDALLPRKTDPTSLNLLHCRSQDPPLFYPPQLAAQVHRDLCLWFSGRLQGETAQKYNRPLNRFIVKIPKCIIFFIISQFIDFFFWPNVRWIWNNKGMP